MVLLIGGIMALCHAVDRAVPWHWAAGYACAFAGYVLVLSAKLIPFRYMLALAVLVRVLLLPSAPLFTDDHFRYFWDGHCTVQGLSPYAMTPVAAVQAGLEDPAGLLGRMNSPMYFTSYPPITQAFFAAAAWIGGSSIPAMTIALRVLFLLVEGLGILALFRLLKVNGVPAERAWFAVLNPVLIVEGIGNLHTEVILVPLLVLTLLAMAQRNSWLTGIWLGLAIATKLWPLLFLLVLPLRYDRSRAILAGGVAVLVFAVLWVPWWTPDLLANVAQSVRLYGTVFEFNGGLYEALKRILPEGWVKGSGLMPMLTVMALSVLAWKRAWRTTAEAMLWIMAIYFALSSTVHPWYVIPLLVITLCTPYRWPYVYALLMVPTYLNYAWGTFQQPYAYIAIEHLLLAVVVLWELARYSTPGRAMVARLRR